VHPIVQFPAPMARKSPKAARKATRPALPRVPLPRQTGGVHEDKTRRPWRRRKHKNAPGDG
jgi:hypothetical protein